MSSLKIALFVLLINCCCVASAAESPRIHPAIQAALDSPDRPEADRQQDLRRQNAALMEFFGVRPGMNIIELFATTGATAELLARIVGPDGKVYMQNPSQFYERAGTKDVDARLANDRLPNVVRLDKPLNDLGLEANSLDGAMASLVVHDFFWLSNDVPGVLKDIYVALRPSAWFAVIDHSAPAGTGAQLASDPKGPHRIDEAFVKKLFAEAGFQLVSQNDILRNPDDDRTKPIFSPEVRKTGTDRFVLLFKKP
jgi:predicted methyltransferase